MIGENCTEFLDCEAAKMSLEQIIKRWIIVDDGNGCPALKIVTANDVLNQTLTAFRSTAQNNTAAAIKASSGRVLGWNVINPNAYPVYLKFYNKAPAINPESDVPVLTLMVPSSGSIYQEPNCVQQIFATAITIRVTKLLGDTDDTALDTPVQLNIKYN